jgi:Polyketide cyclase / dehydrase and lipid transport
MVKKIGIALAVILVAFLGFAATRPATFHLERSLTIMAPTDVVFEQVNVVKARHAWYPWDKLDPNMTLTYSGPEAGVGAHFAWRGNDDVGTGEQTILESVPNQKIVDDLTFTAPMEAKNTAIFTFVEDGAGTKVTWAMEGKNNFVGKIASIFMDLDAMVGKDFEAGLKSLSEVSMAAFDKKKEAEAAAKAAADAAAAAPADAAAPAEAAAPAPASKG